MKERALEKETIKKVSVFLLGGVLFFIEPLLGGFVLIGGVLYSMKEKK